RVDPVERARCGSGSPDRVPWPSAWAEPPPDHGTGSSPSRRRAVAVPDRPASARRSCSRRRMSSTGSGRWLPSARSGATHLPATGSEIGGHLGRGVRGHVGADAGLLLDLLLDLVAHVGVLQQELAGVLLALPQLIALVGVPGAGLADEAVLDAHVDERALLGDAVPVEDVELGLLERRRDLVLDDLDPGAVADRVAAVLEGLDAAHVQAHRGVELQRLAAGGGLRRAEHDADLLAQLVDEDGGGAGVVQRA